MTWSKKHGWCVTEAPAINGNEFKDHQFIYWCCQVRTEPTNWTPLQLDKACLSQRVQAWNFTFISTWSETIFYRQMYGRATVCNTMAWKWDTAVMKGAMQIVRVQSLLGISSRSSSQSGVQLCTHSCITAAPKEVFNSDKTKIIFVAHLKRTLALISVSRTKRDIHWLTLKLCRILIGNEKRKPLICDKIKFYRAYKERRDKPSWTSDAYVRCEKTP